MATSASPVLAAITLHQQVIEMERKMRVDEYGLTSEDREVQRQRRMVLDMRKIPVRSPPMWWRIWNWLFKRGTSP